MMSCILSNAQEQIEIQIPDIVINSSVLKRKAKLFTMTYNQQAKYVALNWIVSYYSDSSGYYGQPISINGVSNYSKETVANNTVMVNPTTGAFVYKNEEGDYPIGSIGQYDFFWRISEYNEVNVHNLIRSYGAAVTNW